MRVEFTLTSGGKVELEIKRMSQVRTAVTGANGGWLWGSCGNGVNLAHVESAVTVDATTVELEDKGDPQIIIDTDGDVWELQAGGMYRCPSGAASGEYTRDVIKETYGIREERW